MEKLYGEINFEYPANLKIEPGVTIKARSGGTNVYIAVSQGGKILGKRI